MYNRPITTKLYYIILQANAQKVQKRLSNKPRHPAQLAADVVERAIATGGDPYLATKMHSLSWWQLSLLDVKLFLAAAGAVMCVVIGGLVWLVWKLIKAAVKRCLGSDFPSLGSSNGQSQQQAVHNKIN